MKEVGFMKLNDKGFSLVELIISVAILALFSTAVIVGLGYMDLANSQKCTSKIETGLMTLKSRNMADSKRTYLYIYCGELDNNYYMAYSDNGDFLKKDLNGNVTTEVKTVSDLGLDEISSEQIANQKIKISYNGKELTHGKVIPIGIKKKDGSLEIIPQDSPTCTIAVEGSSSQTIKLVKATGKYFRE